MSSDDCIQNEIEINEACVKAIEKVKDGFCDCELCERAKNTLKDWIELYKMRAERLKQIQ